MISLSLHWSTVRSLTSNSAAELYCARIEKAASNPMTFAVSGKPGTQNSNENTALQFSPVSPSGIMLRTARCVICGISRGDLEPAHEQASQPVRRALHSHRPSIQYVGVHHRRPHIGVAE